MKKTHKELLNEIMEQVREKAERKKEFRERVAQIEEKKNKGKKPALKEPLVTGYLETKKEDVYVDQYGVEHVYVDKKKVMNQKRRPEKRDFYAVIYPLENKILEDRKITDKKSEINNNEIDDDNFDEYED